MANQSGAIQGQAAAGLAPAEKREDLVRVLRLVEYVGPRSAVEAQVARSIQGEKRFPQTNVIGSANIGGAYGLPRQRLYPSPYKSNSGWAPEVLTIRATTLGTFPDILEAAVLVQALEGKPSEKDLRIMELEKELEDLKQPVTPPWANQALSARQAQTQALQNAQHASMLGAGIAGRQIEQYIEDALSVIPAPPPIPDSLQQPPDPSFVDKLKGKLGL